MRIRALFIGVAMLVGCASHEAAAPATPLRARSAAPATQAPGGGSVAASPGLNAPAASAAPAALPVPAGPGRLHVEARVGREPLPGPVEVRDATGAVVAQALDGETLELPAGTYSLHGSVTNAELLADTPERASQPVTLAAAGEATARLLFGRARIRILVLREGERTSKAQVSFRRHGEEEAVVEHLSHGNYLGISSGRYDLFVTDRGYTVRAEDVPLQNGAAQTIPVTFQ